MKLRFDILAVVMGGLLLAVSMVVAKAYATCTAQCPAGYSQKSSMCVSTGTVSCSSKTCGGYIVCGSSNTFDLNVPCRCS